MAHEFIVNSDTAYKQLLKQIQEDYQETHYLKGKYTKSTSRSIPQNAMIHSMISHVAEWYGNTMKEQKCECKLDFGLPILRRDEERFEKIGEMLDSLTREQALDVIEPIDITSAMNREQGAEMITTMLDYYPRHDLVWSDVILNGK
jgi:hypothetical protein|tara:strand:+ start:621 stop:1058 length:438 start_codon:yes stop_codon:yes gene_type:complete